MPFRPQIASAGASSSSTPSRDASTPLPVDSVYETAPTTPATTGPSSEATSPRTDCLEDGALQEEVDGDSEMIAQEEDLSAKVKGIEELDDTERYQRLEFLLQKSSTYASLLHKQMDLVKSREKIAETSAGRSGRKSGRGRGESKRGSAKRRKVGDSNKDVENGAAGNEQRFQQPGLVTGGTLKDFQLDGVAWMVSLYENGISGILADEMGLGKTLQTIAFCAYLRERANRPFMVVCPLSTLHNWMDEFHKFAPEIPVCMYHGSPDERANLRNTVMRPIDPHDDGVDGKSPEPEDNIDENDEHDDFDDEEFEESVLARGKRKQNFDPPTTSRNQKRSSMANSLNRQTRSANKMSPTKDVISLLSSDEDDEYNPRSTSTKLKKGKSQPRKSTGKKGKAKRTVKVKAYQKAQTFPVVVTTYEIIIKDRKYLGSNDYDWGYIVVDEGHRLKNMDCKLVREIKQYKSACRLILTGTPLHNNLSELWSLLNFILPDIFDDLNTFQQFFNIPTLATKISSLQTQRVISQLHSILKPFLLRRLKAEVEYNLPPKKEYILYAPLTEQQKGVYEAVVSGAIRKWLIDEKAGSKVNVTATGEKVDNDQRSMRKREKMRLPVYDMDFESDSKYFARLERGDLNALEEAEENRRRGIQTESDTGVDIGQEYLRKMAIKQINNQRLQNPVIQLRKVCSHPFLFDWPIDPYSGTKVINDQLIRASGKMLILDRLLDELFRRGHRVLIFSQFTTMLDIIEDWAIEFKGWTLCRIDGSTAPMDRRDEMKRFQDGKDDDPDSPRLFLLSTRAGGLGINLTRADTVIFYDQDWNPQMDMQAQDRAHRIGQTKPVLIFRLVTAHTIETTILQRATEKRKLEALVIAKGKFKVPGSLTNTGNSKDSLADLAASLLRLEGEKIDVVSNADAGRTKVISDRDLDILLDRSPEVFEERTKGWTNTGTVGNDTGKEKAKSTAFEVFETTVDQGDVTLSSMASEVEDFDENDPYPDDEA